MELVIANKYDDDGGTREENLQEMVLKIIKETQPQTLINPQSMIQNQNNTTNLIG